MNVAGRYGRADNPWFTWVAGASPQMSPWQLKMPLQLLLRRYLPILAAGIWVFSSFTIVAAGSTQPLPQRFHTTDVPNNARLIAEATNHMGSWIWAAETFDKQSVHLWKSFTVPRGAKISRVTIWIAADNAYHLYLDGQEIGQGSDWRWPTKYDATLLLKPGTHVLAVSAFNDALAAGVIFGLQIEFARHPSMDVISDDSWRIAPTSLSGWKNLYTAPSDWPHATVVGRMHHAPWSPWPFGIVSGPRMQPAVIYLWQRRWFQVALVISAATVVIVCLWLLVQLATQSKAHRLLHLQRARIARDIHDDLGARLTQLTLQGELLLNELPAQSEVRAQVDKICESARGLANAMDEVVWAVSSRRDTLRDFAAFACRYTQLFLRNTALRCRLDVEPDLPDLSFDLPIRRNLLLAVKEAISNAVKHSGASKLFLRIYLHNSGIHVVVEDNGRGFDVSQMTSERNGLLNMEQRMKEVGGRFVLHSMPGAGCRVEFTSPLTYGRRRSSWLNQMMDEPVNPNELEQSPAIREPREQPVDIQP